MYSYTHRRRCAGRKVRLLNSRTKPASLFEPLEARRLLASGDLIASFGDSGVAGLDLDDQVTQLATEIVPAPDGSLFVVGLSGDHGSQPPFDGISLPARRNGGVTSRLYVAKLTPAGQLDTSYFGDGIASEDELDLPFPGHEHPVDIRPAPGGGYFAVAFDAVPISPTGTASESNVLKLTADFSRDPSFGINGYARLPDPLVTEFADYAPLPDGGVAVLAHAFSQSQSEFLPHRVFTFNFAGELTDWREVEPAVGSSEVFQIGSSELAADAAGRIYVGFGPGFTNSPTQEGRDLMRVIRFEPDLDVDGTYGDAGMATLQDDRPNARLVEMFLNADGRAGLLLWDVFAGLESVDLATFDADGAPAFTTELGQHLELDIPTERGLRVLATQMDADGNVTVALAGSSEGAAALEDTTFNFELEDVAAIMRIDAAGEVDLGFSQGAATFFDQTQPMIFVDAAFTAGGDLLIAGSDERLTYNTAGSEPTIASYDRSATVRLLDVTGPAETVTLSFDDIPGDTDADGVIASHGYILASRPASGGFAADPFQLPGLVQGYPSKVLQPQNWGRKIVLQRQDGAAFDLDSFEFAENQYGDPADFAVTAFFAGGTTQVVNVATDMSKWLQDLVLSWQDLARVEINFGGGANAAMAVIDNIVVRQPQEDEQGALVDFESASIGQIPSGTFTQDGFVFANLPGSGAGALQPLIIHGPAQGYASKVLSTTNWARRIAVAREDGSAFDLDSFDYAAGRWGEAGDFILTGFFEDGSSQTQTIAFSSKNLATLNLAWDDLVGLSINFAGGVNHAYGAVDNFNFGGAVQDEVTVDVEAAPLGPIPSGVFSEDGFTFTNRPGGGGSSTEPLQVLGTPQGFASKALQTTNWGRRIDIERGGATFNLRRLDYAAGRWGEAGDFVLTGFFAGGGTDTRTVSFSSKSFSTLELNWDDLTSVSINWAGGANNAYGTVDNFVFAV